MSGKRIGEVEGPWHNRGRFRAGYFDGDILIMFHAGTPEAALEAAKAGREAGIRYREEQARIAADIGNVQVLVDALVRIGHYEGRGPHTTPWQDIVEDVGKEARKALRRYRGEK